MTFLAPDEHTVALLQAVIETTSEAVLVTDGTGKILLLNRRFEELETITSRDRIQHLATLVSDGEQFLVRVEALYTDPDLEAIDWLTLRDGRIIERYTRGMRLDPQRTVRIWLFRDITSRERAQHELKVMKSVLEALNRIIEPQRQLQAGLRALVRETGARAAWLWGVEGGDFARLLAHEGARELQIDLTPRAPGDPCECLHRLIHHEFHAAAYPITCPRLAHLHDAAQEPAQHISLPI